VIDPANNVTGYAYYEAAGVVKQVADPTGIVSLFAQLRGGFGEVRVRV